MTVDQHETLDKLVTKDTNNDKVLGVVLEDKIYQSSTGIVYAESEKFTIHKMTFNVVERRCALCNEIIRRNRLYVWMARQYNSLFVCWSCATSMVEEDESHT